MLNPFPIQFLSMLAYTLLRICVGFLLLRIGLKHGAARTVLPQELMNTFPFFPFGRTALWMIVVSELVAGVMFLLGFYTQIAAIIMMIFCVKLIVWHRRLPAQYFEHRSFYVLLFFASLSLFITGAGAFAFDLPI